MKAGSLIAGCVLACVSWTFAAGAGLPSRDPGLDVLPGFKNPPPGYGEVPYWWWTGGTLDVERMIGQLEQLHAKGISGVQVNYSHYDSDGWLTDQDEPRIFSEAWWKVYAKVSEACARLGMGIGMSTYTIDWPRGAPNLFYTLFYSKPELHAIQLESGHRQRVRGGEVATFAAEPDGCAVHAYPVADGKVQRGGVDLAPFVNDGKITWTAPDGEWEIRSFRAVRSPGSTCPWR